jgi:hypothetical protein
MCTIRSVVTGVPGLGRLTHGPVWCRLKGGANNTKAAVRDGEDRRKENIVCYLQKSLLGGILLFEILLCEPFFHAKLHALECARLQSKSSSGLISQVCKVASAMMQVLCFQSLWLMNFCQQVHECIYDLWLKYKITSYWLLLPGGIIRSVPCSCNHFLICCASHICSNHSQFILQSFPPWLQQRPCSEAGRN